MEYIYSNQPGEVAAENVSNGIVERLDNDESVLLLVSGGSGIGLAVEISKRLQGHKLSKLSLTLVDERYGEIGHDNENWQQLIDAGFRFEQIDAYRPVIGESIEATTQRFKTWLSDHLAQADYRIGIFGVGTDGHTAGIKPNSPAVSNPDLVSHFTGEDYERITITPSVIRKLGEAVVFMIGNDKRQVLHDLLYQDLPIEIMPAQVLKEVPKLTIYTDNREEEL